MFRRDNIEYTSEMLSKLRVETERLKNELILTSFLFAIQIVDFHCLL